MSDTKVTPSSIRARIIEENLIRASKSMQDAQAALRSALHQAEMDYDDNDTKIRHSIGGLHLVQSAIAIEESTWRGYAAARERS